jgi:hypothetical protein
MLSRTGMLAVLGAIALTAAAPASGHAAPSISLHTRSTQVTSGTRIVLSGQVSGAPAGGVVNLYKSPYPYRSRALVRTATTTAGGAFSFAVVPDRNSRYSATPAGSPVTATVVIGVIGLTLTRVQALPLGRAGVTIVVFHPRDLRWGGAPVSWSFASGSSSRFLTAASTHAYPLSRSVAVLHIGIPLPAGRYRFRACLHAPSDHALLNPRRPPGCSGRGYHGGGSLPVGFPDPAAISRAAAYLSSRTGRTAFAVFDSEGRLSGLHVHWRFTTASVVKAMLLVAYLRRLHAIGQHHVDAYSNSFLYPMIHISDNNAATLCWSIVGDSGLYAIAAAAGMTDFSVSGSWLNAELSPADQAHFFFEMDSLIPPEFVGYARYLLSTIEPSQTWGIPVIARPLGYAVFFKDGSEPTALGQLVHQIARLEGHGRTFALAVMTDGDPTMQYGIDTIQALTRALLRRAAHLHLGDGAAQARG